MYTFIPVKNIDHSNLCLNLNKIPENLEPFQVVYLIIQNLKLKRAFYENKESSYLDFKDFLGLMKNRKWSFETQERCIVQFLNYVRTQQINSVYDINLPFKYLTVSVINTLMKDDNVFVNKDLISRIFFIIHRQNLDTYIQYNSQFKELNHFYNLIIKRQTINLINNNNHVVLDAALQGILCAKGTNSDIDYYSNHATLLKMYIKKLLEIKKPEDVLDLYSRNSIHDYRIKEYLISVYSHKTMSFSSDLKEKFISYLVKKLSWSASLSYSKLLFNLLLSDIKLSDDLKKNVIAKILKDDVFITLFEDYLYNLKYVNEDNYKDALENKWKFIIDKLSSNDNWQLDWNLGIDKKSIVSRLQQDNTHIVPITIQF